jgi:penicillin-binding protein 1A
MAWGRARRRHPQLTAFGMAVAVLAAVGLAGFTVSTARAVFRDLPDESALARLGEMDQATTVHDASGELVFTIFRERRLDVPLEGLSPHLLAAIVAIEDQRFYEHRGFDPIRIAAAALENIRRGRVAQGASTITQQLARQSFLTLDRTYRRKLQELALASRIERRYTKPEILRLYLNKVYFGDGLYGAEAAARGFFGRSASELTLAQAALLAGLVKSPATFAPTVSLDKALERRDLVLQVMRDTGVIDETAWEQAHAEPVVLRDTLRAEEPFGQYFKEQVRRELVARFGWARVYQEGLKVYATLDRRLQLAAEAAVAERLKALDADRAPGRRQSAKKAPPAPEEPLQAALVALDPRTGEVRALVGGRDFAMSSFNRAVQARRQPGSAFKPFVYAAALEAGFTPATIVSSLDTPIETLQGSWTPDEEHAADEPMSVRQALRASSNRAAVRVLQDVGIPKTVEYAKALGVGDVPNVPSLALGSGEVTLLSLTAAYASFANQGLVPKPYLIQRVEDRNGTVLFADHAVTRRAVSEETAYLMADMMADVINAGTASRARRLGFTLPAAGKTGTTNDYRDAWFVGFTPRLVTGVWLGFDHPRPIARRAFAADIAVPLWARFMKEATDGDPYEWLLPPDGVTTSQVCRLSGKLPTDRCEHVYTEYFARGTEPAESCPLHPARGLFGQLAAVFTGSGDGGRAGTEPGKADGQAETASPSKKKRGFWSRLFGRRGGDERKADGRDRSGRHDR